MQPFTVVENEDFVQLVKTLAPDKTPLTRRMLVARIDTRYTKMHNALIEELAKVKHVAATADCWKTFNR